MQREVLSEAIWMVRTLITISSFCITQFTPGFLQNTSMHDFYFEWEVEYTTNGKEILIFVLINSCACMLSLIWLFATPWTVAHQAPLFMDFSRQEYWSRMPSHPSGSSQCTGPEHPVSCIAWWSISHTVIYMLQSILSNHPTLTFSHRVQKSVLYICASFAVSRTTSDMQMLST